MATASGASDMDETRGTSSWVTIQEMRDRKRETGGRDYRRGGRRAKKGYCYCVLSGTFPRGPERLADDPPLGSALGLCGTAQLSARGLEARKAKRTQTVAFLVLVKYHKSGSTPGSRRKFCSKKVVVVSHLQSMAFSRASSQVRDLVQVTERHEAWMCY